MASLNHSTYSPFEEWPMPYTEPLQWVMTTLCSNTVQCQLFGLILMKHRSWRRSGTILIEKKNFWETLKTKPSCPRAGAALAMRRPLVPQFEQVPPRSGGTLPASTARRSPQFSICWIFWSFPLLHFCASSKLALVFKICPHSDQNFRNLTN